MWVPLQYFSCGLQHYMHTCMFMWINQLNRNKCMFWNKRAYETEIGFDFLWPWAIKIKLYHMLLLGFIAWQVTKFCPIFCLLNVICRTCNNGLFYITWTIFKGHPQSYCLWRKSLQSLSKVRLLLKNMLKPIIYGFIIVFYNSLVKDEIKLVVTSRIFALYHLYIHSLHLHVANTNKC